MLSLALLSLIAAGLTNALPQQTPAPTTSTPANGTSTTFSTATITPLSCTSGSTVKTTTDCTYGNTYSFCYSAPPPLECPTGYYPGTYQPGHCEVASTCYALTAAWITTECTGGQVPYSTSTLYQGTLAGGTSTIITQVECQCNWDEQYYSLYSDGTTVDAFCMPYTSCAAGMTTSTRTNTYCETATCTDVPLTTDFCECVTGTPVYPASATMPTTCA
ncbi:MAG: hypothetical protein M1834_008421 [Cirrosporium novae-zelandiae]|nr:MAG: hypothetical protein M1834_008421 [Cirrosporium novae-zelandiae]